MNELILWSLSKCCRWEKRLPELPSLCCDISAVQCDISASILQPSSLLRKSAITHNARSTRENNYVCYSVCIGAPVVLGMPSSHFYVFSYLRILNSDTVFYFETVASFNQRDSTVQMQQCTEIIKNIWRTSLFCAWLLALKSIAFAARLFKLSTSAQWTSVSVDTTFNLIKMKLKLNKDGRRVTWGWS